ncbi:MAG: DUF2062 domain-containing protein [Bacteroidia bacterium]|nr:DUF2062 domain-containing protein [Bacteroidia bacterium]
MNKPENKKTTRFFQPILRFLKQGIEPKQLALTIAIGATIGISPLYGLTTIICALIALTFKMNLAAIQLANYMVYPLQLLLIIPNIRAGEWLFRSTPIPLSIEGIQNLFSESWTKGLLTFGKSILTGSAFWLLYALPLGAGIFFILLPQLKKAKTTFFHGRG